MRGVLILLLAILAFSFHSANAQAENDKAGSPQTNLYVVGTSHLDTQWRWTIQNTINEYVPATFRDNFKLMDIYPDYVFSFEGAFKYMLLREYYPDLYDRLKPYVASGQWRVAGSWVDAVDVNLPSFESLVRQTLYGNGYFQTEFGKTSCDVFLPDCFGFGYALPSIASHCGLKSFSTQKLTWGSSVGVPFDIGQWRGVDGSSLVAALNPGAYVTQIRSDLSRDTTWLAQADKQGDSSGFYGAYMYFGTGDTGGSPDSESVAWLDKSLKSDGPLKVHSIGSDNLPSMVAQDKDAHLPVYDGELLMTRHGVGCYTSEAAMKRWNRKNELLADATERACVIADQLRISPYPQEALRDTWTRFIWHQFHDDLTGTSIPEAYQFSWNDELLCRNRFASLLNHAVEAVASQLDTRVQGIPIIVYNPMSCSRNDMAEVIIPGDESKKDYFRVYDNGGHEVPSQCMAIGADSLKVVFTAEVAPVSYTVYDLRPSGRPCDIRTGLIADLHTLKSNRYTVTINDNGDVSSIYDKIANRELLSAPIAFQLLHDKPDRWPAWEIQYSDIEAAPRAIVSNPTEIEIIESGPVRAAIEIKRHTDKSEFSTIISLTADGDRVEFDNAIDWYERETLLKAAFNVTSPSDSVTYDIGLGTIKRGVNTEKKYEVPGQQWADITSPDNSYGVAVLNDCKYGWDHPDSATLRLSLIHTPGVYDNWNWVGDQSSQDMGHHEFKFAVMGHQGDWRDGEVVLKAARLNQPLLAFRTGRHDKGDIADSCFASKDRKSYSLLKFGTDAETDMGSDQAIISSIKLAENNSDEIVIRVREIDGRQHDNLELDLSAFRLHGVRQINGMEDSINEYIKTSGGRLSFSLAPYQAKAFAILPYNEMMMLSTGQTRHGSIFSRFKSERIKLPYDTDGISLDSNRKDGDIDGEGNTLAGELLPDKLWWLDVPYEFGPKSDGQLNVVSCRGQVIDIPKGKYNRLCLLATSTGGPSVGDFRIGKQTFTEAIPDYASFIGQWNSRLSGDDFVEEPNRIAPAYINDAPVAWYGSHRHTAKGENEAYRFTYLFLLDFPLPEGAKTIGLPNNPHIKILAATAAGTNLAAVAPAQPLCDRTNSTLTNIHSDHHNFLDSTQVSISCPIPGAAIRYTTDGSAPEANSIEYTKPFFVTEAGSVRSRAILPGADDSYIARAEFNKLELYDADHVDIISPGLQMSYYEGSWDKLPDFNNQKTIKSGVAENIAIPDFARKEDFGLTFDGYIKIPSDGLYRFYLSSDDGSRLTISDTLVVDNDGLHGEGDVTGEIALKAGFHKLAVDMFQAKGDEALGLQIEGPGIEKSAIPAEWLVH